MNRRKFAGLLGGAALILPLGGLAQAPAQRARIVILTDYRNGRWPAAISGAFRQGLRDLGWTDGANAVLEERHAATEAERLQITAEMERARPDVIFACPSCAIQAAPAGTAPIRGTPIVFTYSDPVAGKLVQSLSRPGGSMTGLAYQGIELNTKRLQLLKEAVPALARVGVLVTKDHALRDRMVAEVRDAAATLNLRLLLFEIAREEPPERIDAAFEAMARDGAQAVLGLQGPHFYRERARLTMLAAKHRLPGTFDTGDSVEAGAFMTYEPNFADLARRAATYIDKILKGARPADLPVEQPRSFELALNLRTARTLGLTVPPSLRLRADRVIE